MKKTKSGLETVLQADGSIEAFVWKNGRKHVATMDEMASAATSVSDQLNKYESPVIQRGVILITGNRRNFFKAFSLTTFGIFVPKFPDHFLWGRPRPMVMRCDFGSFIIDEEPMFDDAILHIAKRWEVPWIEVTTNDHKFGESLEIKGWHRHI